MKYADLEKKLTFNKLGVFRFMNELNRIFHNEGGMRQAAALTFTTLLSLVPLFTIAVMIFSAFPAFGELKSSALNLLSDLLLPNAVGQVTQYMSEFLVNATQMTVFGVITLMVTSILLMWTIEAAFNKIWHVNAPRPIMIRILSFWAVLTLAPMFIAVSIVLSKYFLTFAASYGFGSKQVVWKFIAYFLPLVFEALGFTLLYIVVPHKKVNFTHAFIGGLVAALLLEISKHGFGSYHEHFPVYQTIYGAVSAVPIFLIWLYLIWLIVLYGAMIAAHLPNYKFYSHMKFKMGSRSTALLAVMLLILQHVLKGCRENKLIQESELRAKIGVQSYLFDKALARLHEERIIMPSKGQVWIISCEISNFSVFDICRLAGYDFQPSLEMLKGAMPTVSKDLFSLLESGQNRVETMLSKPLSEVY